jgi:hypothetical protein
MGRPGRASLCAVGVLGLACAWGCVVDPRAGGGDGGGASVAAGGEGEAGGEEAFAPARLRVHPLTHVEPPMDGGAGSILVLHVELRDRFGDNVKGLGMLRVELLGPDAGTSATLTRTRVEWDVADMGDPEMNSRRFDGATRTYRVPLEAPAWVAQWARDRATARGGGSLRVRATLITGLADGRRRVLTHEMELEA